VVVVVAVLCRWLE